MPPRASVALIAGALGAVASYALLRLGQKILFVDPDPALVFYSEHAGYFWRAWIAAYLGGIFASLSLLVDPNRVLRMLPRALLVAVALLAAQALLVP